MAAGIATEGLLKFSRAKTTPNPEFCIPTSIESVLAILQFFKRLKLTKNPNANPIRCKQIKAKINSIPEFKIISFPWPTILATIRHINRTAVGGAKGIILLAALGKYLLTNTPKATGNKTTFRVLKNRPSAGISR